MRNSKIPLRAAQTPSPLTGEGRGEGDAIGTNLGLPPPVLSRKGRKGKTQRQAGTSAQRLAVVFLSTITLSACTVGPDYVRPKSELPAEWRVSTADALGSTDIAWWRGFHDPILDQLIDEAVREIGQG